MTDSPSGEPLAGGRGDDDAEKPSRIRSAVPIGSVVFLLIVAALIAVFVWMRPTWFTSEDWADVSPDRQFQKTLLDMGLIDGVRLSDDSSTSQSFSVALPKDSQVSSAVLLMSGTTSAASSGAAFLRVLVDGTPAYVAQLPAGSSELQATVALPPSSIEDGGARIQIRVTGSLDEVVCNTSQATGALVMLDPEQTQVRAVLDVPLHSVRDLVADLNDEVVLDMYQPAEEAQARAWFETALRLATSLTQAGHTVTYAHHTVGDESSGEDAQAGDSDASRIVLGPPDALAGVGWDPAEGLEGSIVAGSVGSQPVLAVVEPDPVVVAQVITTNAVTIADTPTDSPVTTSSQRIGPSPVTLTSLGTDTSVQQITSTRSWRTNYSLADLPGGTAPTLLNLAMNVPETSDDARWLLNVQLNGELIAVLSLTEPAGRQTTQVAIPDGLELMRNQLVITLVRDQDVGGCAVQQTTYSVQLLPESSLALGGMGSGFTAIPAAFSGGFVVDVPSSSTDAPEEALAGLVPTLAEFSGWQQYADVVWDGVPGRQPFLHYGTAPAGTRPLVVVADGRITTEAIDLDAFENGVVVQTVSNGSAPGLLVTSVGSSTAVVPPYGRQEAWVMTDEGGGFIVSETGSVETVPAVRSGGRG